MLNSTRWMIQMITVVVLFGSCSEKSEIEQESGTILIQIPKHQEVADYQLEAVQLHGISNLKEVRGEFARFFFAPGSNGFSLTGGSPKARFLKSNSTFVPLDFISAQMATIYYHLQNLALLDQVVGANGINQWPRLVGLETQIIDQDRSRNNAFYDGQTDSMMFVPFTAKELPIAINAGIIAHEHFHSLFFKTVIATAFANKKMFSMEASVHEGHPKETKASVRKVVKPRIISEKNKAMLFNEVYLRGLNEGFADFWGWLYTEDVDFMKWSLPKHTSQRTLSLQENMIGMHVTENEVFDEIQTLVQMTDEPRAALANYSYKIGTPHARFLKRWAIMKASEENVSLREAKMIIAQKVITYLKQLQANVKSLEEKEILKSTSVFQFFAEEEKSNKKLSLEGCEFLVKYLNYGKQESQSSKCVVTDNVVVIIQ